MNLEPVASEMRAAGFKGKIESEVRLDRFTTYRLGGPAALFLEPSSVEDLRAMASVLAGVEDVDVLPLGRGSNLVVSESGFPGIVVRLGSDFSWIRSHEDAPDGRVGVAAGAATTMPQLANWTARRGISGFEWMISIPGSVGGGVRMNAGAHDGDLSQVLARAVVWKIGESGLVELDAAELEYSYRSSNLDDRTLVVEAHLHGVPADPSAIRERMEGYRKHRAETQPGALQNAGSVFKNPEGDSAGRLVEAAGLKGYSVGGARVSELHANFFIAGDGATAQDVRDLVDHVRAVVAERSGVRLVPEIRFVGSFRETADE